MKKSVLLFLNICIAILLLFPSSCKKTNNAADTQVYVIATIDGSADTLQNISTKIANGAGGKPALVITGTATANLSMRLDIYIHQINAPATIDVTKSYYADFGLQDDAGNIYESANDNAGSAGTIIISKNDTTAKRVEGSFSGVALNDLNINDKKTITSGIFKISY